MKRGFYVIKVSNSVAVFKDYSGGESVDFGKYFRNCREIAE